MNNIVNNTSDKLLLKPTIQPNIMKTGENSKKLPVYLSDSIDGKILVVAFLFLLIMFMPAHIGAATAFVVGLAMGLQLKHDLSLAQAKIKKLEQSLFTFIKANEELENNSMQLIETTKAN